MNKATESYQGESTYAGSDTKPKTPAETFFCNKDENNQEETTSETSSELQIHRVYLSGPITGVKGYNHHPIFEEAKEVLTEQGFLVISPHEFKKQDSWEDYMKIAIRELCLCTDICMLPCWEYSHGAAIEKKLAEDLGIPVFYFSQGLKTRTRGG